MTQINRQHPIEFDEALYQQFVQAMPHHIYMLLASCLVKAVSTPRIRSIVLLAPNEHHTQCLNGQPELRQVAESLALTSLRVICKK